MHDALIYLDYAATTPCADEVVDAMLPFFSKTFGNAASVDHPVGGFARKAVEQARAHVADLVSARPEEVIFTSGATESNNLALSSDLPLVYGAIEHPSIREAATSGRDRPKVELAADSDGCYEVSHLSSILDTLSAKGVVSLMWVNNETGSTQDLGAIAKISREHDFLVHTDASQGIMHFPLSMRATGINAVSLSAHKIYGPKGIGALVCDAKLRAKLRALTHGGGHERGLRPGTLNVPGIVGFGAAARIAKKDQNRNTSLLTRLRQAFKEQLIAEFPRAQFNCERAAAPHICSITLPGVNNRALLQETAGRVAFSLGSACSTGRNEPSHVLLGIGLSTAEANSTIRCSFGLQQSEEQVKRAAQEITLAANRLGLYVKA